MMDFEVLDFFIPNQSIHLRELEEHISSATTLFRILDEQCMTKFPSANFSGIIVTQ